MPPRRLALLLIALASGAIWIASRSGAPDAARPSAGTRIIAFGDSLVAGNGTSPGGDFVSALSNRLGVPILNAGRSGDTTGSALRRLEPDVLARDPRLVIVLLGGNDWLRRVPKQETFRNLAEIVERIRARGAAVVLVGTSAGFFDPYGSELEQLAERTSAALVPDILDGILGRTGLMADAIHPNNAGHAMMADRIEPVLRELTEGR